MKSTLARKYDTGAAVTYPQTQPVIKCTISTQPKYVFKSSEYPPPCKKKQQQQQRMVKRKFFRPKMLSNREQSIQVTLGSHKLIETTNYTVQSFHRLARGPTDVVQTKYQSVLNFAAHLYSAGGLGETSVSLDVVTKGK